MEMPKIPPKGKLKAIDVARSEPFRSASLIKSGIPTNRQFPLLGRPSCMAELSQPKALLTEAASSCPGLVDGNRAVRTRRECQQQPECAALPPNPGRHNSTSDKSSHFQSTEQQKLRDLDRESFYIGSGNKYGKEDGFALPEDRRGDLRQPFPLCSGGHSEPGEFSLFFSLQPSQTGSRSREQMELVVCRALGCGAVRF